MSSSLDYPLARRGVAIRKTKRDGTFVLQYKNGGVGTFEAFGDLEPAVVRALEVAYRIGYLDALRIMEKQAERMAAKIAKGVE